MSPLIMTNQMIQSVLSDNRITVLDLSDCFSFNYGVCARMHVCWSSGWVKLDLFMGHHNTGFILRDKRKASRNEDEVGAGKMDGEMKL